MIRAGLILGALCLPITASASELPFDVGGPFTLIDQNGKTRTEADPDGRAQLLFFGYANCLQICSAALPLIAEITEDLESDGIALAPVMITVDPARDTVDTIGPPLEYIHRAFVGLTGSETALQTAYDAFSVEKEYLFDDPEYGPVYSHGSFIYLLSSDGEVLSLLPPILSAQQAGDIVRSHVGPGS